MLDIERLREYSVITTEKPAQQMNGGKRHPIYIVEKVLKETKEVVVIAEDKSRRILGEKELSSMCLVSSLLYHRDRGIQWQRKTDIEIKALAICQEAEQYHGGLSAYIREMNPDSVRRAKDFLQETLETEVKVDPSMIREKRRLKY